MVENCIPTLMVTCLRLNAFRGSLWQMNFPRGWIQFNIQFQIHASWLGCGAHGRNLPARGHFTPAINLSPEVINLMFLFILFLFMSFHWRITTSEPWHWSLMSVALNSIPGRLALVRQITYCLCTGRIKGQYCTADNIQHLYKPKVITSFGIPINLMDDDLVTHLSS